MAPYSHGAMPGQDTPELKQFTTTAAKFALKGHELRRSVRSDDGRVTYTVSRWNQSRVFTNWHDLESFLVQIGGAA